MASPSKSKFKLIYGGRSVSRIVYPKVNTVTAFGLHSGITKVIHGPSADSDGFTPTELYREKTRQFGSYNSSKSRGSWIDYAAGKYVYYWNTGYDSALSAATVYDRTRLPGFSPRYNYANNPSLTGFDSSEVAKLNHKVLGALGEASLDIGMILVEMKDTVNWINKRSTQLAEGLLAAKRGNLPKMGRVLGFNPKKLKNWNVLRNRGRNPSADALSSLILETNFAIKPLISDISDAVKLFHDPQHNIFRGRVRSTTERTITEDWDWAYRNRDYHEKMIDNHKMVINYQINDPDLIARKALGLATNPATAWEGVPYSWLVDYVFGVGDFLAETVATQGLVFLNGTTSRKIDVRTSITNNLYTSSTKSYRRGVCKYTFECYKRSVMLNFPSPSLDFVFDDITATKSLNVLALAQKLRR